MNVKKRYWKLTPLMLAGAFVLAPGNAYGGVLSSITGIFESKKAGMEEVATKVATLDEKSEIWGLDFSLDGKHLAATPFDSTTVHIWNWKENHLEQTLERARGSNVLVSEPIRYSQDGKLLAICHHRPSSGIVARIWNSDTWEIVHDMVIPLGGVGCDAVGFTSDGKYFVRVARRIGFPGQSLVVHDVSTWQVLWGIETGAFEPSALTISPDGKFIALAGGVITGFNVPAQSQIAIVDTQQRKIVRTIQPQHSYMIESYRIAWSPDSKQLAYAGRYGVEIFDTLSWERVVSEQSEAKGRAIYIRYTPDGKYFIESGFGENSIRVKIWDGKHQQLFQEIKAIPGAIAVSRNGRYLAMGGNKKIIVWQLK